MHSVVRIGFPTSVLDLIQEMGRCGRSRLNDGANPSDDFYLFLSLTDFTCSNERLCQNADDDARNKSTRIMDCDAQLQLQRNKLLEVLRLTCLSNTC